MDAPLPLAGLRFSISGSAGDTTSGGPVDRDLLKRCHVFVSHLTTEILRAGGEIVLFVGREPRLDAEDPQTAQVFSWTELEAIAGYCPHRSSTHSGRHLVRAVVAADPLKRRIPENRVTLWEDLLRQQDVVSLTPIPERSYIGGHQRERQAEQADVLITLGGGKGVFDLDRQCRERGCLILPLDPQIGSSCNDGEASPELNREAFERPERFAPAERAAWFRGQLPRLSFYGGTSPEELAKRVVQVIMQLAPPAPQGAPILQPSLDSPAAQSPTEAMPISGPIAGKVLPEKIHFLVLCDEWWSFKGGISTFNRDLCKALARAGHRVSLFIPRRALTDAERDEIRAIPRLTLVESAQKSVAQKHALYRRPVLDTIPDVIVGHGAVTGPMASHQRDEYFPGALLTHFIHVSPMDTEYEKGKSTDDAMQMSEDKDEEQAEVAMSANMVVAIGPLLERSIQQSLQCRQKKMPVHMILPWLHELSLAEPPHQNAGLFIGRAEAFYLKGLPIAIGAVSRLGGRPIIYIRGATQADGRVLKLQLKTQSKSGIRLRPQRYTADQARIDRSFRRATVVLMPSRTEGFGLVGLEAIMRGIPLLASAESGLGEILKKYGREAGRETVVEFTGDDTEDAYRLSERLARIWTNPPDAFKGAHQLLGELRPYLDERKSISGFIEALRALPR